MIAMASIFDHLPGPSAEEVDEAVKPAKKRSKHRDGMTPTDVREGKTKLSEMVEFAFNALEDAVKNADHATSIKAAQIILDRSGFGPKSTIDVNQTNVDLSTLSRDQLAERATALAERLRQRAAMDKIKVPSIDTPVVGPTH